MYERDEKRGEIATEGQPDEQQRTGLHYGPVSRKYRKRESKCSKKDRKNRR